MKKILLSLIAGFVFINTLNAKKISGYYITNSQDTVKVMFDVPMELLSNEPNLFAIQWKIKYFDSKNEKQVLKPAMAKEIYFVCNGIKYTMLSRTNTVGLTQGALMDNKNVFLHLIKDGKIKLFRGYFKSGGGYKVSTGVASTISYDNYVLQKGKEELFKTKKKSFRKDMDKFISDCPDLMKKIEAKIYSSDDLEKIIEEYNLHCK